MTRTRTEPYLGQVLPSRAWTVTPELLRKAGSRFESYADQRPEL